MNETIATGLQHPEGPVALPDERVFIVEMGDGRQCLTVIEKDGTQREICHPGGRPAGLAVDGGGCFWVAGGPKNSLVRLSPDGQTLQVIEGGKDGPFLYPRDLAFGPDGLLYMTDSGVRIADLIEGAEISPDFFEAPYNGRVYQIDPSEGRVLRTLATGLFFANGIAFGADGLLYYSETLTGKIFRQVVGGRQELFARVVQTPAVEELRGPAGLAFDRSGVLYCAIYGRGEIRLVDPRGNITGNIRTNGMRPSNIAFTADGKHAVITEQEQGAVERIPAPRPGLPLHAPSI